MAPLVLLLLVFIAVVCHRGVDARLRLDDAAHQAARAASLHRSSTAATAAARETTDAALAHAGVVCRHAHVATSGSLAPGSTVSATVSCEVDFGQALLLGVPGSTTLQSQSTEVIDTHRSAGHESGQLP